MEKDWQQADKWTILLGEESISLPPPKMCNAGETVTKILLKKLQEK